MRTVRNLIGADHVDATSGERIDDLGPDDGSIIATLPRSRAADVDDAVTVASAAQVAWAAMPLLGVRTTGRSCGSDGGAHP